MGQRRKIPVLSSVHPTYGKTKKVQEVFDSLPNLNNKKTDVEIKRGMLDGFKGVIQ